MGATVVSRGQVAVDVDTIAKAVAARVPGMIAKRVDAGLDVFDRPFAPYGGSYMHALTKGGESTVVDLRLTGGMLASVKVREVRRDGADVVVVVAPDAGTSPAVSLADGKAKRTGRRGPAHNVVGYWIHHGTPTMPARPWLGLSPNDMGKLVAALDRLKKTRPA